MLHLVGQSSGLNSSRAHRKGAKGALKNLGHGIYCDLQDTNDVSEFARNNAIRIANYLYPKSSLSHASAFFKGPVPAADSTPHKPHYKLFLCGPYHKVRHLEELGLTIVQYDSLSNSEIKRFCDRFDDGKDGQYGPMELLTSTDEMVFLQNFGRSGAHSERFLSDEDMIKLRERLEEAYEGKLVERLSFIVQSCHDYGREFEQALKMLSVPLAQHRSRLSLKANPNAIEYTVGWSGREVAKLVHNGANWLFNYVDGWVTPLHSEESLANRSPAFVNNLLPEGTMRDMLRSRMSHTGASSTLLEQSHRYMSNISIVRDSKILSKLPFDALETSLSDHCDNKGAFRGRVLDLPMAGPAFLSQASDVLCSIDITRIAGMQAKIAMNLSYDGDLVPAINLPTTHILKLPGIDRDTNSLKGVVEWTSMSLVESSGLQCSRFALVELPGSPTNVLGLISERFDIPQSDSDMRMIYTEDLCTMMGMPPEAKGMPMLNDVIKGIKRQSTDWKADSEEFFRLVYVNYVLENADFHTKNASLIKIARPMLDGMRSVRMAPAYDIMRTAYFLDHPLPNGVREPMQLGYIDKNGALVDDNMGHEQFREFAEICEVPADRAMEIMREAACGISNRAQAMAGNLPDVLLEEQYSKQREVVLHVLQKAVSSCHDFFPDLPATLAAQAEARHSSQRRVGAAA